MCTENCAPQSTRLHEQTIQHFHEFCTSPGSVYYIRYHDFVFTWGRLYAFLNSFAVAFFYARTCFLLDYHNLRYDIPFDYWQP